MNRGAATGSLLILFLYDVADAIRLDGLRETLGAPPPKREPPFRQPAPEYVRFEKPPVIEPLPPVAVQALSLRRPGSAISLLTGSQYSDDSGARIGGRVAYYESGIVTIQFEVPFEGYWEEIVALAARWMNAPELEAKAAAVVREHVAKAGGAIVNGYRERLSEDYCIMHLRRVQDDDGRLMSASELIAQCADYIAQIVRGEVAIFAATERAEILESRMSYYENDVLVVGWSAALVYDTPEGADPTIQLLEYANTQLLQFRHYDAVLTALLSELYRSLERGGLLARWRLAREAERLNTIRLDIRELTERVDNSIKFLSDMFAARLYHMAATKIGVPDYRTLVDQKLQSAGELYGFMMDRFYQGRAFVLELMVVIILVIELVFLFRGVK
ncbi:MAG TPA: hypothetical protein VNY05_36410 [Candidatus Acidoferrales bacterium]|jgi:hypothetical protein|nr:hypothetical protein [Candidatus Acidoferrales bacterium]